MAHRNVPMSMYVNIAMVVLHAINIIVWFPRRRKEGEKIIINCVVY